MGVFFEPDLTNRLRALAQDLLNAPFRAVGPRTLEPLIDEILLDCFAPVIFGVLPRADACSIVDIGCGAGIPSLALAMVLGKARILGIDSTQKKIRFCEEERSRLGLGNLEYLCTRLDRPFRTSKDVVIRMKQATHIVSRGFAKPDETLQLLTELVSKGARSILYTSDQALDEALERQGEELVRNWRIERVNYQRHASDTTYLLAVAERI